MNPCPPQVSGRDPWLLVMKSLLRRFYVGVQCVDEHDATLVTWSMALKSGRSGYEETVLELSV